VNRTSRPRPVPPPTLREAAYAAMVLMQVECDIRPEVDERMLTVMKDLESVLAREARVTRTREGGTK